MCGIVGLWNRHLAPEDLSRRINNALNLLEHRGPDDEGIWLDSHLGLALGHRRLSIIDTSHCAHQPMVHASGDQVLVLNGEIYNYRDLRHRYVAKNNRASKFGDTAVLLDLLEKKRLDTLELIDGMFAFAFFDKVRQELLLARDRFGEKPLYWTQGNGYFAFTSELTALQALLRKQALKVDEESLAVYHMIGSVPAPKTIYKGIYALLPGHFLKLKLGRSPELNQYWHLGSHLDIVSEKVTDASALQRTQERFMEACRSRMVSDVPVGVFLSGGIDSNAILATTAVQGTPPQAALCVDFQEKEFSEFSIAKTSAEQLKIPLNRYVLDQRTFEQGLPAYFKAMDQPATDGFNTYFLSMAAYQTGIKVWLSGVGGDELFGGYPSFTRMPYMRRLIHYAQKIVPSMLAFYISGLRIPRSYAKLAGSLARGNATTRAYQINRLFTPPAVIPSFLRSAEQAPPGDLLGLLDTFYPQIHSGLDDFQAVTLFETAVYMRAQLLRDIDNFSMAHSIEVRAPFLDHKLFAHVLALDRVLKQDHKRIKPLLQDAVPGGLPEAVPKTVKRGFVFPVDRWLRKGIEANYRDVVLDTSNAGLWDLSELERLWIAYKRGALHWSVLWMFYSYSMWIGMRI